MHKHNWGDQEDIQNSVKAISDPTTVTMSKNVFLKLIHVVPALIEQFFQNNREVDFASLLKTRTSLICTWQ